MRDTKCGAKNRDMSTMRKLRSQTSIQSQCVHAGMPCFCQVVVDTFIVLDPSQKNSHIKKHWNDELYKTAMKCAEDLVCFILF